MIGPLPTRPLHSLQIVVYASILKSAVLCTGMGYDTSPIRLFPNFYGTNTSYQAFVLIHEGIHHFTRWTDTQVANNLGIPTPNYGTADITTWIQGGCQQ